MKMRRSHTQPQVGDIYAKAGTPGLYWVVHRLLPDIDPGVPHVELLRVGDASTRVTISLPALVDPRMFEPVERDAAIERQLAEMGIGRARGARGDEPPAAARDADRGEAAEHEAEPAREAAPPPLAEVPRRDSADDTVDHMAGEERDGDHVPEAPSMTDPGPGDTTDEDDDRVTRLYPADRADDALESLESIAEFTDDEVAGEEPSYGDESPDDGAPRGAAPGDTETAEPALWAEDEIPAADDLPEPAPEEDETAPVRDRRIDDLFASAPGEADDFDRLIAAADPDRAGGAGEGDDDDDERDETQDGARRDA